MFTKHIKSLIARLGEIEVEFMEGDFDSDVFEKLESEVYDIERRLNEFPFAENQSLLKKAEKIVSKIKKDNGFDNLDLL